jgi:transposase InsO family protein
MGLKHKMDPLIAENLDELILSKKQHYAELMGIRRMTYHLRTQCRIFVSHSAVYDSLKVVDREGLDLRRKHKLHRRIFAVEGPNQVWSLDGHDKLKHWGFPIHGCNDGFSRYLLWIRVGTSNNDPRFPLACYLDAIEELAGEKRDNVCISILLTMLMLIVRAPLKINSDRGTETVDLYSVHTSFHRLCPQGNLEQSYKYSKSVHNQKIECFWSQFIKQYLQRWRNIFQELEFEGLWEYGDPIDEAALIYIFMPILRAEVVIFQRDYNNYPIRYNPLSQLPCGAPYDNYFLSGDPNVENDLSIPIERTWMESARQTLLKDYDPDAYMDPTLSQEMDQLMTLSPLGPHVHVANAREQYLYLRDRLHDEI